MAGRPNPAWLETMIKKHGSREAVSEHMKKIAAKGGKLGRTGGYYANPELAVISGSKGGKLSKRGYKFVDGEYIKC